jgi:hypothetical protein
MALCMIWLGIILGFIAGSVVWTLMYAPTVERCRELDQRAKRDNELRAELLKTARRLESENAWLTLELDRHSKLKTGYGPPAGTL